MLLESVPVYTAWSRK